MRDPQREVINTWDQLTRFGGDRIAICYDRQDLGRGGHPAKFIVLRLVDGVELVTNPKAAWYDYGHKTFIVGGVVREQKPIVLAEAMRWVAQVYGKREFVRNHRGDYVEAEVNAKFPLPNRKRSAHA